MRKNSDIFSPKIIYLWSLCSSLGRYSLQHLQNRAEWTSDICLKNHLILDHSPHSSHCFRTYQCFLYVEMEITMTHFNSLSSNKKLSCIKIFFSSMAVDGKRFLESSASSILRTLT